MTRRLILIRHAKSSWADPLAADHGRPLNARGCRSADAIGTWLANNGHHPREVLCSDARRTRETWDLLAPHLPAPDLIGYLGQLYHASAETMLAVLQSARHSPVLMLGHNPGISAFAARILAGPPPDPALARYPTAATLIADFDIDRWADADFHAARIIGFVTPRELGA